ncbi:MAG: hypothetical protein HRT58_10010 [Crocinitomicaceae bacterium]|nr:hypothetical protein [Flavobacteriales bacterium]NQZ35988.1 hypothetical protein [Crocinitomicaceae bacterium]
MSLPSYKEVFKRREDFMVKYRFYTIEENGRKTLPHQHIRNDFWYDHKDHKANQIFMIYPEFEDLEGEMIVEGQIYREGIAKMWILMPDMFEYHKKRIKVGQKGYFHEGARKTAICEIIEITGLTNL